LGAALEGFDDDHGAAATRANERLCTVIVGIWLLSRRRRVE
jgi:Fe-S-cluster formation regulator IscX/YfhJ